MPAEARAGLAMQRGEHAPHRAPVARPPQVELLEQDESFAILHAAIHHARHADARSQPVQAVGFGGEGVGPVCGGLLQEPLHLTFT
jgi:hypothetical protein